MHDPIDGINSIINIFSEDIQKETFKSYKSKAISICVSCKSKSMIKIGIRAKYTSIKRILNTSISVRRGLLMGVPKLYYCPTCECESYHRTKNKYENVPDIMIINIVKDDEYNSRYNISEDDLEFGMSYHEENRKEEAWYRLVSIVSYDENTMHSVSFIKIDEKYYRCDDSRYREFKKGFVNNESIKPYLLIYERIE
eukprot:TRINITY_DN14437_c0_g1_i1.p1 TRINITY_DN14437_c0_g1~~TRINITY_DN14437_c0_g1_i1.p1  ORF type:complete len:197 (+),score=34.18 TRINITY_DN14437_c0_g1_i1:248-838(+)